MRCEPYSLNDVHGRIRVCDQLVCHTAWNLRQAIKELQRPSFVLVTNAGCKAHSATLKGIPHKICHGIKHHFSSTLRAWPSGLELPLWPCAWLAWDMVVLTV